MLCNKDCGNCIIEKQCLQEAKHQENMTTVGELKTVFILPVLFCYAGILCSTACKVYIAVFNYGVRTINISKSGFC